LLRRIALTVCYLASVADISLAQTRTQSTGQTRSVLPTDNSYSKAADEGALAIKMAREARTLAAGLLFARGTDPETFTNDFQIRGQMSKVKGDLRIVGWKALKTDNDTYLVTYTYEHGVATQGWPFEVKLSANVVRYVIGDQELEQKYGWTAAEPVKAIAQAPLKPMEALPLPPVSQSYVSCGELKEIHLFARPDWDGTMLETLACFQKVSVLETLGSWVHVRTQTNREGYVGSAFVAPVH